MKMKNMRKLIIGLAAVALSACGVLRAEVITLEDFSGVTDGTALPSVPGWSLQSGTTNATVSSTAGYSGAGATMNNVSLYRYTIPTEDRMTAGGTTISGYSVKLQLGSVNSYQQAQILAGKNDGVNGLAVVFDGGTSDANTDNAIKISSGGTGWGSITYTTMNLNWKANDWYQVDFSNISLVSSGYGSAVTGYVTITDLTTSTILLSNQLVTGFGNSGTFNTIDSLLVGNKATSRQINFDDLSALAVPEPGALSLVGLTLLSIPLLRRRIRIS